MAQIKFSQKSIQGLPEALAALLLSVNAQGTAGSLALTTAIDVEVLARSNADTTLTNALNVVNGDSTVVGSFRKAIADVIGSAPEALNTLKEIADYIAVNPEANVADAINAAIAAANLAVANLAASLQREVAFNEHNAANSFTTTIVSVNANGYDLETHAAGENTYDYQPFVENFVTLVTSVGGATADDVLNYGTTRYVRDGVSYDLPVFAINEGYGVGYALGELAADVSALVAEPWFTVESFNADSKVFKIQLQTRTAATLHADYNAMFPA